MIYMREIPKKNYFILLGLIIGTLILLYYATNLYENTRSYRDRNMDGIPTITIDELSNYVKENPNMVLYIRDIKDYKTKSFENSLKRLVGSDSFNNEFIYIDTVDSDDIKILDNYFSSNLEYNKNVIVSRSNILIFKDGRIVDALYQDDTEINIRDVRMFFLKHGIIGDEVE